MGNKHRIRKRKKKNLNKKILTGVMATTIVLSGVVMPALGDLGIGSTSMVAQAAEVEGDFTYINNGDGTATITKYSGSSKTVTIPSEIGGLDVTSIGTLNDSWSAGVFYDKGLTSITIPNSVTLIGGNAFSDNNLTSITLPNGVTHIGMRAFSNNNLTTITVPNSVTHIESNAFYNNNLTAITIPNGVTHIKSEAFYRNELTEITIPGTVESVGAKAFENNLLTRVTIQEGVETIGKNAFYGQRVSIGGFVYQNDITHLELPDSLITIEEGAFGLNENLKSVNLPKNIKHLSGFDKTGLTSLTIPEGVETIGLYAFRSNKLTEVVMPNSVTSIDNYAFQGNKLAQIDLADTITTIGSSAFKDNILDTITVPKNIETIGNNAFEGNNLTKVTMPKSTETVGTKAFANNDLAEVIIEGETTRFETDTFAGNQTTASNLVMFVPNPSVAKNFAESLGYTLLDYVAPEPEIPEPEIPETPEPEMPEGNTESSDDAGFNLNAGLFELATTPIKHFGNIEMPAETTKYQTGFEGSFNVKDFSGAEEGWRVDVSAGQFEVVEPEGGFVEGTEATVLPIGTLALNGLESIERVGNGSSDMPTSKLDGSTIIDDGTVTVVGADAGAGMGEFDLLFPEEALTLTLDPTIAKIDKVNYPNQSTPYKATVSWDLVQAP